MVPAMVAGGAAVPGGSGWAGPEGRLYNIVAVAFIFATSVVDAVAPSARKSALGAFNPSTTNTVTLYPSAWHLAMASCAIACATSSVSTFEFGSWASALPVSIAPAAIRTASLECVIVY
jgi:hypothetical protein